jgi:hypothetical protein
MDDFCSLSRYAPEDIDTDAKRKDKFLNGLKGELKIPLSVAYAPSYQALLDQAVTLDNNNIRKEENRKRKFNNGKTHTKHSHKRHHSTEGNGNGSNFDGHRHNGGNQGNHSNRNHSGGNGHHNGGNGNHNGGNRHQNGGNGQHRHNTGTNRDLLHFTCFKCRKTGHFANNYPENKQDEAAKPNPFKKGHVNHINVEEVMGTFPLNSFTALDFI